MWIFDFHLVLHFFDSNSWQLLEKFWEVDNYLFFSQTNLEWALWKSGCCNSVIAKTFRIILMTGNKDHQVTAVYISTDRRKWRDLVLNEKRCNYQMLSTSHKMSLQLYFEFSCIKTKKLALSVEQDASTPLCCGQHGKGMTTILWSILKTLLENTNSLKRRLYVKLFGDFHFTRVDYEADWWCLASSFKVRLKRL